MKKLIVLIILVLVGAAFWYASPFLFQETAEEVSLEDIQADETIKVPTFREVELNYSQDYESVPFVGSALIDIDGDGVDEVFLGGSKGQEDGLFAFNGSGFENIIAGSNLSRKDDITLGSVSLDVDHDDDEDLIVSRASGLYLYLNDQEVFQEQQIELDLEGNARPFSIAAGDVNNDGWADLYLSTFIKPEKFKSATFNDPQHKTANIFLLNNGDNTFTDLSEPSGLNYKQNTFLASFVDLNDDGWQDLVLAPNTDKIVIFENLKDGTFLEHSSGTDYGFWMGLAIGDVDQDGDQDLFFSNSGNTVPESVGKGDLNDDQILDTEWALLRNDGNFQFTQINTEKKLTGYEFAWGSVFEDFNLDGRLDLIVVENYVKWPAHKLNKLPGRLLLQQTDETFAAITEIAGAENPHYGMTPLVSDFDQDGYPDLIYVNINGKSRALLNKGGDQNFITIALPDNVATLGAKVTLTKSDGSRLYKHALNSTGFLSDQSSDLTFGLGSSKSVQKVEIKWLSGEIIEIEEPDINRQLQVAHP